MKTKITIGLAALGTSLVMLQLFAAFEAHVINVTARIENALYVHPESLEYGTVFPQEHLDSSFFITFSQSFSTASQTRVGKVDYVIKQKPKPREDRVTDLGGVEAARDWCHLNVPANPGALNDHGLPPFHDPELSYASGTLVKFDANGTTNNNDPGDIWTIDLAVPCFNGYCAQDWADFVHGLNPTADPDDYMVPPTLEHQVFGCDLWVEVTKIY